jgi:hypothetical protein
MVTNFTTQVCLLGFRQNFSLSYIPISMSEGTPHVFRGFVFESRSLSFFFFVDHTVGTV